MGTAGRYMVDSIIRYSRKPSEWTVDKTMFVATDPHHVSTQQLAQLHRFAGIGCLSSLVNALIFIAFFWGHVENVQLLVWLAAVMVAASARLLNAREHRRTERVMLSSQQSSTVLLLAALNGVVWGVLPVLLYPAPEGVYQVFLIFMLSIASASALPWYIALPGAYVTYLFCVLAPMILVLATGAEAVEQMMALMLFIFAGTLAITARTMHDGLMEALQKYFGYQQMANVDTVTQLANRRALDETLAAEWKRAARSRLPLTLIMVDIDCFKNYNDIYGHQEGDACLNQVAAALARSLRRSGDLVARYGGEEFAVVLPQMARNEAMECAERMRRAVADLGVPHSGNTQGCVTVSLGGATCIPDPRQAPAVLIKEADDALYQAKKAGRDQIRWKSMAGRSGLEEGSDANNISNTL